MPLYTIGERADEAAQKVAELLAEGYRSVDFEIDLAYELVAERNKVRALTNELETLKNRYIRLLRERPPPRE